MSERENARDTQFQGFAKALFEELEEQDLYNLYDDQGAIAEKCKQLLTHRAYDFAKHIYDNTTESGFPSAFEAIEGIPDMTELPKEQE